MTGRRTASRTARCGPGSPVPPPTGRPGAAPYHPPHAGPYEGPHRGGGEGPGGLCILQQARFTRPAARPDAGEHRAAHGTRRRGCGVLGPRARRYRGGEVERTGPGAAEHGHVPDGAERIRDVAREAADVVRAHGATPTSASVSFIIASSRGVIWATRCCVSCIACCITSGSLRMVDCPAGVR